MEFLSNVHVSAEFLTPLKILDADIKTCMLSNGAPVACTTLRVCVNHTGLTESLGKTSKKRQNGIKKGKMALKKYKCMLIVFVSYIYIYFLWGNFPESIRTNK